MHKILLFALLALSVTGCAGFARVNADNGSESALCEQQSAYLYAQPYDCALRMNNTKSAQDSQNYPEGLGQK